MKYSLNKQYIYTYGNEYTAENITKLNAFIFNNGDN